MLIDDPMWNGEKSRTSEALRTCLFPLAQDIKSDLLGSVVVAGGTTVMPGFVERLKEEVDRASPPTPSFSATIVPSPTAHEPGYNAQRKHAPWIGGSILASLPPFKEVMPGSCWLQRTPCSFPSNINSC